MKKFIPNTITSLNLVAGSIGVMFAFYGRLDMAFYCMIAAAVFDFFDGFVARKLGAVSKMGVELDSLCDLISFGVLPAIMLHSFMKDMVGESYLTWIPLVLVLSAALRLAKFNTDERQKDSFLGLATPAAALLCASIVYYICQENSSFFTYIAFSPYFVPSIAIVLAILELVELPMFSMKCHKDDDKSLKNRRLAMPVIVLVAVVLCVVFSFNWSFIVMTSLLCYILINLVYTIFKV